MKKSPLLLALTATLLTACQSPLDQQIIDDQDAQLTAHSEANRRMQREIDKARIQNATLQEQLDYEQSRTAEMESRMRAQEAALAERDSEVEKLAARLRGTGVDVERRGDYIVLNLPSGLTFPSGKAELTDNGRKALQAVAGALNADYQGRTFWIEGHTDNQQPKKSGWASNLELSVARAMGVAAYLRTEMSVPAEQLRVSGHGEFAPKEGNDTAEGREANRRVEILVLN